jgi:hypothetical protein
LALKNEEANGLASEEVANVETTTALTIEGGYFEMHYQLSDLQDKGSILDLCLRNTYGNYAYYDNLAYYEQYVADITVTLKEFSALSSFALYIRHKLFKDRIFDDLVGELNSHQLDRIEIVVDSEYEKEESEDWTQGLQAGEVVKSYVNWQ